MVESAGGLGNVSLRPSAKKAGCPCEGLLGGPLWMGVELEATGGAFIGSLRKLERAGGVAILGGPETTGVPAARPLGEPGMTGATAV